MTGSSLRWPLYALAGLLVAAAVAFAATRVVNQQIGISSEPVSAGRELSPAGVATAPAPRRPGGKRRGGQTAPVPATPAPAPAPAPAPSPPPSGGGEHEGGDD